MPSARTTVSRLVAWFAAAAVFAAFALPAAAAPSSPSGLPRRGLAALEAVAAAPDEPFVGIAVLADVPSDRQVDHLRGLGLTVQGMRNLPLASMYGTKSQLLAAADVAGVLDVYPDVTPLTYYSEESTAAMRADVTRNLGFTGKDVGIAIVDTGVDATHPVLADHVVRNVKMLSPEYLDLLGVSVDPEIAKNYLAVPVDQGPYNNSDTSGHGTHVAGIAAGDGTDNPDLIGVAPDANIIGYGTGDIVFIFTIIAAFDDLLTNKDAYNIRVVNNSWGSSYRTFDPMEPTNVATKALHDAGITVVFAAGNSEAEMAVGPNSAAPWVIGVGSTTTSKQRSSFSSGGLMYDNSKAVSPDENGYVRFVGDGLGIYAPDVSAPGTNILGPGTPTGVGILAPSEPGGTATISGTSMAAPHVAGLAAVLLEANPDLTPAQIEKVLEVTAVPLADGSPFWHAGFGFVDAVNAVELVTRPDFSAELLDGLHQAEVGKRAAARDHSVLVSDHFTYDPLPATAFGLDSNSWEFEVRPSTDAIRASIAFDGDLGIVGINLLFDWALEVTDADGTLILETSLENMNGYAQVDLDELELPDGETLDFGTWTATMVGYLSSEQPALLYGGPVSAAVVQLREQVAVATGEGPTFAPTGEVAFAASGTPDEQAAVSGDTRSTTASGGTGIPSPEGCEYDDTVAPSGSLSLTGPGDACYAGQMGYATNYGAMIPGTFTSAPLSESVTIGGPASIVHYVIDSAQPGWSAAGFATAPAYALSAVDADGNVTPIAAGDFPEYQVGPEVTRAEYVFDVPPTVVPAGSQLRLEFWYSGFYTSGMRMVYGGPDYADAGLYLTTGVLASSDVSPDEAPEPAPEPPAEAAPDDAPLPTTGGGPGILGLAVLAAGYALRRRPARA